MLPVTKLVSPVRAFDASMLQLYRWMAERYVAPLATVIGRGSPPRVASEEDGARGRRGWRSRGALRSFRALRALQSPRDPHPPLPRPVLICGRGTLAEPTWWRRSPLRPVLRSWCDLRRGRRWSSRSRRCGRVSSAGTRALVLVPDASPVPATAVAIREAFGDRVCVLPRWGQAFAVPDLVGDRGGVVRGGRVDAAGGVRAARSAGARSTSRASRTRATGRNVLPTTTCVTWRWPGRVSPARPRSSPLPVRRPRPRRSIFRKSCPRTGDGPRSRWSGPVVRARHRGSSRRWRRRGAGSCSPPTPATGSRRSAGAADRPQPVRHVAASSDSKVARSVASSVRRRADVRAAAPRILGNPQGWT